MDSSSMAASAMPSVQNYYEILGIGKNASDAEIKKAFRERAKRLHPDIVGNTAEGAGSAEEKMRILIAAYETLLDGQRRYAYDRMLSRLIKTYVFDYRKFLQEEPDDPKLQARLIFFELLHDRGEDAIKVWRTQGALSYAMRKYMDREDWMDCAFLLAEELDRRHFYREAYALLHEIMKEEQEKPYFKHFAIDVRSFLKNLTRKIK
jgi:curved DNA-binding protein CbpA